MRLAKLTMWGFVLYPLYLLALAVLADALDLWWYGQ